MILHEPVDGCTVCAQHRLRGALRQAVLNLRSTHIGGGARSVLLDDVLHLLSHASEEEEDG